MYRGAWWATVHGVTKSRTQLSARVHTRAHTHTHTGQWLEPHHEHQQQQKADSSWEKHKDVVFSKAQGSPPGSDRVIEREPVSETSSQYLKAQGFLNRLLVVIKMWVLPPAKKR